MTNNYEHYISRNIKAFYKRQLVLPSLYVFLLVFLWYLFSLQNLFLPNSFSDYESIEQAKEDGMHYVSASFENLTFTGYTTSRFGATNGYFYYVEENDQTYIVLLSPSTCEEGLPTIEYVSVNCRLMEGKKSYKELLYHLSNDLDWTTTGINSQLPSLYFSEPDYNPIVTSFLFAFYMGSLLFSLICIGLYTLYILSPSYAPACQNLVVFGSPKKQLEEAEEELATLPQLATEDMFITEHYFILTSPYGNAIVPIQEILWIYKYSTLHKFLWYHFSISYTLHISANKHFYLQCPKNMKSDIDGIMDYLSEANHKILVGFNEENRIKIEAIQGKPFHIEKLYALLRKKV